MHGGPAIYQLTPLELSPASASIHHINIQGNTANSTIGTARKRAFDEISGYDEETFAQKHLATEGSVFFRPKTRASRGILWRILHDRKLLEVQCVDLVQDRKFAQRGTPITIHINLPVAIIRGGVALADAGEKDAIEVFILTTSNDLYTVTLKSELLTRGAVQPNFDSALSCQKYASGSFGFRSPYRIVAASNLELFISLNDGGLLRLDRKPNENGAHWRETFFSEGGWRGTIKGMMRLGRAQTVRWENLELEANAIAAVAKCPNGKHVWTVSLDHTLKAWDTETGKIATQTDLLNEDNGKDDQRSKAPFVFGADQESLFKIVQLPSVGNDKSVTLSRSDELYFLVVYSPKDHQFKFFKVTTSFSSVEGEGIVLEDLAPKIQLIPPVDELLNTNLWHLEQFEVSPGPGWKHSQLWIRARSGAASTVFALSFDLKSDSSVPRDLADRWRYAWTVVDPGSFLAGQLKAHPEFPKYDAKAEIRLSPHEHWLPFLFFPGRFSVASLETALTIYRKSRSLPDSSKTSSDLSLPERLVAAIQSDTPLRRLESERPDFVHYQTKIQAQWAVYYSLLLHLQNRRQDSVGFAFDPHTKLALLVSADFVSPIRENTGFEKLCNNSQYLADGDIDDLHETIIEDIFPSQEDIKTGQILAVANQFRKYFSEASQEKLRQTTTWNAFTSSDGKTSKAALDLLYKQCGFEDEISSDDWDEINGAAELFGGLGNLSDDDLLMVLEKLQDAPDSVGRDLAQALCLYGKKLSIAITQETLQRMGAILLDLLALVVFMAGDLEPSGLHEEFRPTEIYESIMLRMRENNLRLWLVSKARPNLASGEPYITLYESIFVDDWVAQSDQKKSTFPQLLTSWSKRWALGLPLTQNWDDITGFIMANLLKYKNLALADEFSKFLSDGPWSLYLKGRSHLALGNYDVASILFKDAADDLPAIQHIDPRATTHLFTVDELKLIFSNSSASYFQHISTLFDNLKIHSYTADFASLALQAMGSDLELNQSIAELDLRKSITDSPANAQIDVAMEEIRILRLKDTRDELLARLFQALVQTGRFEQAYNHLTSLSNPDLQRDCLHTLLQTCVRHGAIDTLLQLPIHGNFVPTADDILLTLTKQSFAKRPSSSSVPAYHQILFAFRVHHARFRDASAILYEHLQRLQSSKQSAFSIEDPDDDALLRIYVLLINTLACCGDGEMWFLADPILDLPHGPKKRRLVTLEDVRREYAAELDRRSDIAQGRFPLVAGTGGDEMDVF